MNTAAHKYQVATGRTGPIPAAEAVQRARENPLRDGPGPPPKEERNGANGTISKGSNQAEYLLRRLARDFPEILDAFERGEYPSIRQLKHLCRDEPKALDAIDKACKGRQGRRTDLVDNVNEVEQQPRPDGNSRDAALRRLRDQRPDLHERVLAGEMSAHAAMVEAGFRKRLTPLDRLWAAWRAATPDQRAEFLAGATR